MTCVVLCESFKKNFFYNNDKCKFKIPASEVAELSNDSESILFFLVAHGAFKRKSCSVDCVDRPRMGGVRLVLDWTCVEP